MDGKPCGVRRERLSAIRTCCLSDGIGLAGVRPSSFEAHGRTRLARDLRHAFVRILRIPQTETRDMTKTPRERNQQQDQNLNQDQNQQNRDQQGRDQQGQGENERNQARNQRNENHNERNDDKRDQRR